MTRRPISTLILTLVLAGCASDPTSSAMASPVATASVLPIETPPVSTTEPTATATPVPALAFDAATVPDSEQGSSITAVAPGGDGLVAVGFDGSFGTTLWTSADGRSWRDITPAEFGSIGVASMIATSDGRLLGVGRGATIDVDTEAAAAFVSGDGLSWRPAEGAVDLRGQMIDVVETTDGFVAAGGVPGADAAGVWYSPDGEAWQRVGQDVPAAFFWSIAEGGPGLVIAGWRRNPEPDASVWTSADDGRTWDLASDPPLGELAEGTDILATDSGRLIMVGGSHTGDEAFIWISPNGVDWSGAEVDGGLVGATVRNVAATSFGHVAVGSIGTGAAAWLSTDDGATWVAFGEPVPEAYFHNVFVTDFGVILVGARQTGTVETGIDSRAMMWIASLDE